jgi:hypothetical protein
MIFPSPRSISHTTLPFVTTTTTIIIIIIIIIIINTTIKQTLIMCGQETLIKRRNMSQEYDLQVRDDDMYIFI